MATGDASVRSFRAQTRRASPNVDYQAFGQAGSDAACFSLPAGMASGSTASVLLGNDGAVEADEWFPFRIAAASAVPVQLVWTYDDDRAGARSFSAAGAMSARRFCMMQPYCEGPMTRATHGWGTRATRGAFMSSLALLPATLGVLATTVTPTAAQSLTRGPVLIETHHTDLAGNIRLSTNEAGDVTQRLDYAPFGEVDGRSCTGGGDPTLSSKFQGNLRDPKTCLDDFGARDYYRVTGRFQSVDPVLPLETALRDPQQWHRYAYARNNPLIYTDPDGRVVWWIAAAAGGAAFGGGLRIAENLYDGRAWHEGVVQAAAVGAVTGVVGGAYFSAAARVTGPAVWRIAPRVSNEALANSLKYIYKANDTVPCGLPGAIRDELRSGIPVGGKSHIRAGFERIRRLERILRTESLDSNDRAVAEAVLKELRSALAPLL